MYKKMIILTLMLQFVILLVACGNNTDEAVEPIYNSVEVMDLDVPDDIEDEPAYSHNSLIIMVEGGTSNSKIEEICNTYGMSVMYEYENMSGYALSLENSIDDEGLDELIKELETYDFILGVEKDYIMQLDEDY